jgi:hypothetical protein
MESAGAKNVLITAINAIKQAALIAIHQLQIDN